MGVESQLQMEGGSKAWQSLAGSKGRRLANANTANPCLISAWLSSTRPASPRLLRQVISTRNGMPAKFSSILASLALIYD